ncbi:hypothetical protein [Bradyrhizobium retamae]|uniref:Uncharacterized protein n=1 Tax=Bradyrhizobium retamae TaxID=1300035 RepID=A0A0R3MLY4_9BRAD|nr:hypothetical protein [Bradyrhizobium retamae]KRR18483.1 hypothetical protein CQ13_34950 [Bradyrhizobium retamae]
MDRTATAAGLLKLKSIMNLARGSASTPRLEMSWLPCPRAELDLASVDRLVAMATHPAQSRFVSHVMPTPWLTLHRDLLYGAI